MFARKKENQINDKEWFSVWMMTETKKKMDMEKFELQELRNVVKQGGQGVMIEFRKKDRELKVEAKREKVTDVTINIVSDFYWIKPEERFSKALTLPVPTNKPNKLEYDFNK